MKFLRATRRLRSNSPLDANSSDRVDSGAVPSHPAQVAVAVALNCAGQQRGLTG